MAYYRHPYSAACFPAPSGCRLRGKSRMRGRSAEIDRKHSGEFFQGPPKSLQICPTDIPKMTQRVQKRVLSGNEIWAPKHAQSLYSERIHKEPYREMGSSFLYALAPKIGLKSTKISTFFDLFVKIHTFNKTPPGPSECPP